MTDASESGAKHKVAFRIQPSPEREFERLYRESYDLVYKYVRYRMREDDAAEDVVAEAYLKAARSFSKYDPARAKFSTWVVRIAANCMKDHWKRARPATCIDDVPEGALFQPDDSTAVDDRELVDRLLGVLDDEERDLVLKKYLLGYRNVDIAEELGMNASTVATRLSKALAKMRSSTVGAEAR